MKTSIRRLLLGIAIALLLCTAAFAAEKVQVSSYAQAEKALLGCLSRRDGEISLSGWSENVNYQDPDNLIMLLRRAAANDVQTDGSGSDYDVLNVYTVRCSLDGDTLTVRFTYLTTAQEEAALDASCAEILKSLSLDGLSDYEKVLEIYEYVGTHFVYDESLTNFSAYQGVKSGKMVCQGFALLMHKLLWAEGIESRILTGITGQTPHGWNIVKLGGKWYHLDVTWDACKKAGEAMSFTCFLRCEENFPGHVRHAPYRSDAFLANYPIAQSDYDCNEIVCTLQNEVISALTMRLGMTVSIVPNNLKNEPLAYTLRSTDPSVAEITADGTLTAKKTGSCSIFVTTDARGVVPSLWRLTVVDLTKASAWAYEDVEAYYLAALLPDSLCSDFQKPITRAELARLLYPVLQSVPAQWKEGVSFIDTFTSPDAAYIEYAAYLGVVSGTGNGRFSPDATLTREQAAKVIALTAKQLGAQFPEEGQTQWTDEAQIGSWAVSYISAVDAAGIMRGTGEGRFSPKSPLTREQMICMLVRMINYCAETQ